MNTTTIRSFEGLFWGDCPEWWLYSPYGPVDRAGVFALRLLCLGMAGRECAGMRVRFGVNPTT